VHYYEVLVQIKYKNSDFWREETWSSKLEENWEASESAKHCQESYASNTNFDAINIIIKKIDVII
jgi:hypothetical protein